MLTNLAQPRAALADLRGAARRSAGVCGCSGFAVESSGEKLITVVNWPYPVVYGLWRKTDDIGDAAPQAVGDPRERLGAYITGSRRLLERYSDELAAKLYKRPKTSLGALLGLPRLDASG